MGYTLSEAKEHLKSIPSLIEKMDWADDRTDLLKSKIISKGNIQSVSAELIS